MEFKARSILKNPRTSRFGILFLRIFKQLTDNRQIAAATKPNRTCAYMQNISRFIGLCPREAGVIERERANPP
jgi:hypothetical protein